MIDITIYSIAAVWLLYLIYDTIYVGNTRDVLPIPEVELILIRRDFMADILVYSVEAALPVDPDVVKRVMSVAIDGGEATVSELDPSTSKLGMVEAPQGSMVVIDIYDVDDAGNKSDSFTLEFQAIDTLPPAMPGGVVVTLVEEKAPKAEDPVQPEPTEDPTAEDVLDDLNSNSES